MSHHHPKHTKLIKATVIHMSAVVNYDKWTLWWLHIQSSKYWNTDDVMKMQMRNKEYANGFWYVQTDRTKSNEEG